MLSAPHSCGGLGSGHEGGGRRQVWSGGLDVQNQRVNQARAAFKDSLSQTIACLKILKRQRFKDNTDYPGFMRANPEFAIF